MKNLRKAKITTTITIDPVINVSIGEYIPITLLSIKRHSSFSVPVELSVDEDGKPLIAVREKDLKYVSTFEKEYEYEEQKDRDALNNLAARANSSPAQNELNLAAEETIKQIKKEREISEEKLRRKYGV